MIKGADSMFSAPFSVFLSKLSLDSHIYLPAKTFVLCLYINL